MRTCQMASLETLLQTVARRFEIPHSRIAQAWMTWILICNRIIALLRAGLGDYGYFAIVVAYSIPLFLQPGRIN